MGVATSACKINFESLQTAISKENAILINTLPLSKQECLIAGTLDAEAEVETLNKILNSMTETPVVIVYGENACDSTIVTKYNQLVKLGFANIKVYPGGMFEWLLLQDIYGCELFPTTSHEADILKYK